MMALCRARFFLTLLALAIPVAALAGPNDSRAALSREWKRVRSANFTVVGNAREGDLKASLNELERFRQALLIESPSLPLDPVVPTVLVLFRDDASFMPYKPRDERGKIVRNVGGYFLRQGDVNYMVAPAAAERSETFHTIFHEYTHYVLDRTTTPVPRWVSEGLAEFYSTFHVDREGRAILGQAPADRIVTLRGAALLPLSRFLTHDGLAKAFRNAEDTQRFYAQAWALVHYSVLGPRRGQLGSYLNAIQKGLSIEEAFRVAYKVSLEELETELRNYARKMQFPAVVMKLPDSGPTPPLRAEPMLEADALQVQGDLLMRAGALDEAELVLTKALKTDSSHIAARVSLAGVARQRDRRAEAIAMLQGLTAEAPGDFASHYWLGVELSRAHRYEEAVHIWGRAVTINERSADAWLELSVVAIGLGRASQGQAAFLKARALDADPTLYYRRAHRLFDAGHPAPIVSDVTAYVRAVGWGNERSSYMAFLGALAHWRLNQPEAAEALLAQVAAAVESDSWAAAVTNFLRGALPREAFLQRADGLGERTEAHAYIGLKASIADRRDEAIMHLTVVAIHGGRYSTVHGLAKAELRRLQAAARR